MGRTRRGSVITLLLAIILVAGACGSDDEGSARAEPDEPITVTECLIRLHGKGGGGAPSRVDDGLGIIEPSGNAEGWDARQWLYAEDGDFEDARGIVATSVEGTSCTSIVIHGFSNGGAMAAALYCAGEDLDQRVVGYIIDDPVTDLSSADCSPSVGVEAALYWTGALEEAAPAGTDCASLDWTCDGTTVRGIDAFAADLGVNHQASVNDDHAWYEDAPEIDAWLGR